MKQSIWKFKISQNDKVTILMPKGSKILTLQVQNGIPCIWVLVDVGNENENRCFEVFGTGHNIPIYPSAERKYINTFQLRGGEMVFHLFEIIFS